MKIKNRILIVNNDFDSCEYFRNLLRTEEYEIICTRNTETLEAAIQHLPDVILLDIVAPATDGFELCQELRQNTKTATIPITMVIDWDNSPFRLKAIEAGADNCIFRPYEAVELCAHIRNTLRLNRFQHLQAEKAKFDMVADAAEHGYMLINKAGQCVFANPKARSYINLAIDAPYYNKLFKELVQNEYHLEPEEAWLDWTETLVQSIPHYLIRPATEHSNAFWLQIETMGCFVLNSEMIYMIELRDVTKRKENVVRAWKFEHTIAHKMNTPLTNLMISLDGVKTLELEPQSDQNEFYLDVAYRSATNLQQSVKEILDYMEARHNVGDKRGHLALADIHSMIQALCVTLQIDPDRVNISYSSNVDTKKHLVLDGSSMELVLWEILENARKFHPDQSPQLDIYLRAGGANSIILQIMDDGQTLTPEQLAQVWTAYYQAEKFFAGNVEGMGLGLTLVSYIVWNIGGKCIIRNRPDGVGILVELHLPLR